jgi:hypothetical protein
VWNYTVAEEAPESKPSAAPEGVFGNLPGTRPGTRSPRRRSTNGAAKPAATEKRRAAPPPPPPPPPAKPPPAAEREAPVAADTSGSPQISSVEDLAWAGIAVAAQAATVGVRFASRALEAARKSVDRD